MDQASDRPTLPGLPSRRWMALVAACSTSLLAPPAHALPEAPSPRSLALGDSMRAVATGALGPFENPSGMSLVRQYSMEALYGFDVQSSGSTLDVAVVDSVTSKVAAGIYYTYVNSSPNFAYCSKTACNDHVSRSGSEWGLALSLPLGERLFYGVTSKYMTVSTQVPNPDPAKASQSIHVDDTTNAASADGFTIDTGATMKLGDSLSLAVVGYNLIPLHSLEAPLSMGMGLGYMVPSFTAAFDVVIDFDRFHGAGKFGSDGSYAQGAALTTTRLGGGFEYLAGGKVPIRLGAAWDGGLHATYLSAGLGFMSPTFAADITLREKVDGGSDTLLTAGIRLFLQ